MGDNEVTVKAPVCDECEDLRTQLGVSRESVTQKNKVVLTTTGKVLLGVFGASFVGVTAVCLPFIVPALRKVCLPYVPATPSQVGNVLRLLQARRIGTVVDLGSGDGRIVVECARQGFQSVGVELNPWLVWYSRIAALRAGVSRHTSFYRRNLWKVDLSPYNNVVVFGVEQMMPRLEEKLCQELSEDGIIIACRFPLPNWPAARTEGSGIDTVWLYRREDYHNSKHHPL